jgi:signal transduction histidine kinase
MAESVTFAVAAAAAVAAAGIALFTLTRRPSTALNRAAATLFGVLAASHLGTALGPGPWGEALWTAAEAWVPGVALLFGLRLGSAAPGRDRGLLHWILTASLLYAAAVGGAVAWLAAGGGRAGAPLPTLAADAAALGLLFHIAALVQLENVFRSAGREARYRVKYLVLGLAAMLAMRLYVLSMAVLYRDFPVGAGVETAVATVVGGALCAYAIVRHRLLGADVFISRYVVYNSIAVGATGAYLLIVGASVYGLTRLGSAAPPWLVASVVMVAVLALAAVLLSDTARWRIRHFVDRNFYKNRHDYRVQWQAVSRAVAAERTVEGFLSALERIARQTLGARQVATYLKAEDSDAFLPRPGSAADGRPPIREADLHTDDNPAWQPPVGGLEVLRDAASRGDVRYLPLRFGDDRFGLVALWPRVSGAPYHLEDLELVTAMAAQTGIGVRNLQLAQDLARSRETAALHQVSTFFLHDMKNVANSLALLARNVRRNRENPAFWADAETGIGEAVAQIGHLTDRLKTLRQSGPAEGHPIELGSLLAAWAREWGAAVSARVEYAADGPLPCRGDAALLKSVFTNLVVNAAEAGASVVRLEGGAEDGQVRVGVVDDGAGMEPAFVAQRLFHPFVTTKAGGMGIGLFQARRIVEQLGGRLAVESRPGAGTRFTVTLPGADAVPAAGPGPGGAPRDPPQEEAEDTDHDTRHDTRQDGTHG